MGNRAVITTPDKQIGAYMHWNGGRDSVNAILTYCKLHSYRKPEQDNYGWARICQVISNFIDADGNSVGIDRYECLDTNNGDNGVYIIKDWEIVGREFFTGAEQDDYDLVNFLNELDRCMPEQHRIGNKMILDLLRTDKTISEVTSNYFFTIKMDNKKEKKGFEINKKYRSYHAEILVKERINDNRIVVEYEGQDLETDIFHWRDGRESINVPGHGGYEHSITSAEVV
ncbi:MAG: hypothetical protein RBR71_11370 [Gudongella sp.]|nr:hypothetical protein [Gudongella sp.]